jgi:hypothetical protein
MAKVYRKFPRQLLRTAGTCLIGPKVGMRIILPTRLSRQKSAPCSPNGCNLSKGHEGASSSGTIHRTVLIRPDETIHRPTHFGTMHGILHWREFLELGLSRSVAYKQTVQDTSDVRLLIAPEAGRPTGLQLCHSDSRACHAPSRVYMHRLIGVSPLPEVLYLFFSTFPIGLPLACPMLSSHERLC